jgi:hypothetical protein
MREFQAGSHSRAAIARLRRQLVAALVAHLAGLKPNPPLAGVPLWQVFGAVSARRGWGPNGPDPIRPTELRAWADQHRVHLPPHHAAIIEAMDDAWLAEARAGGDGVAGELTGETFDAMFG